METIKKLFFHPDLETWANVLEVVGFSSSILGLIISLFIRSELKKLKTKVLFGKTITSHIKKLQITTTNLNRLLENYDENIQEIRLELSTCPPELEDIISKLSYWEGCKIRRLKRFIKRRTRRTFVIRQQNVPSINIFLTRRIKRLYETSYDDIWVVYERILGCIRQLENLKRNNNQAI